MYSTAKIYKLQGNDGKYYIGSTRNELRKRFAEHKSMSKRFPQRHMYNHFNQLGWDEVKIVLVSNAPCSSREELLKLEDDVIQQHLNNEMCLNVLRAQISYDEKLEYSKQWNTDHKEMMAARTKDWRDNNREKFNENQRRYRAQMKAKQLE